MAKKYKIAVLGGGLAGLSFVRKALQSELKFEDILIIQESPKTTNDRTWCYWSPESKFPEIKHIAERTNIHLSSSLVKTTKPLKTSKYFELNSLSFYKSVYNTISTYNKVNLIFDSVKSISNKGGSNFIETQNKVFEANFVINTIPKLIQKDFPSFGFNQNFYGQRIKLNTEVFIDDLVTLMDFESNLNKKVGFFYILPYNKSEALIEYTQLSHQVEPKEFYVAKIQKYLWEKFHVKNYQAIEEEEGIIPMTNFKFDREPMQNVFQLGAVGGDTKATTGYTLSSVQRNCDIVINHILNKKPLKFKGRRFKFYDTIMLYLMEHQPQLIPNILATMFQRNNADVVLKFLDEQTTLWQEAKIFMSLPWAPFLSALKNIYFQNNEADLQIDTRSVVGSNL